MKRFSYQIDIDWMRKERVFVHAPRPIEHILYCARLYSAPWIKYNRSGKGKVFLFPRTFNENQAKEKGLTANLNCHQAITQAIQSNHSAKYGGRGERALGGIASYTQTHTHLCTQWGGCLINLLSIQFLLKNYEMITTGPSIWKHIISLLH